VPKLWNWTSALTRLTNRRALQALTLAAVAAVSIALPALGGSSASILRAQNGPPPAHTSAARNVPLPGSLPNILLKAKRLGAAGSQQRLNLVISLPLSDPNGLAALLASQQDPKSAHYHQYLSPNAFISRFAPSTQAVAAVRQFLAGSGLKVTGVSANRTLISASGSVTQAERAFGVTILRYQLGKRTVYAPDRAPQIPDSLAPYVLNIGGLDNVLVAQPLRQTMMPASASTHASATHAQAATTTALPAGPVAGAFSPTQLRGAYDVGSLISASGNGSGQKVSIFELAPYIPGDVGVYRTQYGLPPSAINNISVDGAAPTCAVGGSSCDTGGSGEADLDIEDVSALAPYATQDIFTGPNSFQGVVDTYNAIVLHDDPVTTTSWGACELFEGNSGVTTLDQIFAQGSVQGQTIASAAGDTGSDACLQTYGSPSASPTVLSPASDPYVLGVGGTSLSLGAGGSYGTETTWNHNGHATGGGISIYLLQPSWQVGGGVVNTYSMAQHISGLREVPDVAADADPNTGYSVYCTSKPDCAQLGWVEFGGTSAAAPLWAGVLADINAYLTANGQAPLGWVNPTIYELFSNAQTYPAFHDVTTGNNDVDLGGTQYAGDYPATTCYDLTTGVGSPDAWNIARDVQGGVALNGGGPCPAAPSVTDLVQNGGFEQGTTGWTSYSSGGKPVIGNSGFAHGGQSEFLACLYATCDDRVSQTITIPAAGSFTKAQLTIWVESLSSFPIYLKYPPCLDHLYVTLSTPDGTALPNGGGYLVNSCNSYIEFGYQYMSFDVTSQLQAYAGQRLILTLRGTTTNETVLPGRGYTGWAMDDIALTVS